MSENVNADYSLNPHARGHQEDRINVGAIGVFGVGLVTSVVIVFVVVAFMMVRFRDASRRMAEQRPTMLAVEDPDSFPGARLQESPGRDMDAMRAEVNTRLNTYGWVNEPEGVAHIPIGRALELAASSPDQHGLTARPVEDGGTAE